MQPETLSHRSEHDHAVKDRERLIIRFPLHSSKRSWAGLLAKLQPHWRLQRCVVIHGRRYWQPY